MGHIEFMQSKVAACLKVDNGLFLPRMALLVEGTGGGGTKEGGIFVVAGFVLIGPFDVGNLTP